MKQFHIYSLLEKFEYNEVLKNKSVTKTLFSSRLIRYLVSNNKQTLSNHFKLSRSALTTQQHTWIDREFRILGNLELVPPATPVLARPE